MILGNSEQTLHVRQLQMIKQKTFPMSKKFT